MTRRHTRLLLLASCFLLPWCGFEAARRSLLNTMGDLPDENAPEATPRISALIEADRGRPISPGVGFKVGLLGGVLEPASVTFPDISGEAARLWLSAHAAPTRAITWHLRVLALGQWMRDHLSASQQTQIVVSLAPFGRGARGLDQAAETYFGDTPDRLNDAELLGLVALTQSPARLDPECAPDRLRVRRAYLAGRLLALGRVTAVEAAALAADPLVRLRARARRCPE